MTAQIGDRIFIDNIEYSLACEPLSSYLYDNKIEKLFTAISTSCYSIEVIMLHGKLMTIKSIC